MFTTSDEPLKLVSITTPPHSSSALAPIATAPRPAAPTPLGAPGHIALPSPVAPRRGGLPPNARRRVLEYVALHLEEKVTIECLARIADLSPFHFARAFKQSIGVAPHDYLIRLRVKRVMELLAETDLTVSAIAHEVGFSDQSHCARRFREYVGVSPADYRWSMR